ncbi:hypothetical protein pb186bvf_003474 [Paramecium bursaria]
MSDDSLKYMGGQYGNQQQKYQLAQQNQMDANIGQNSTKKPQIRLIGNNNSQKNNQITSLYQNQKNDIQQNFQQSQQQNQQFMGQPFQQSQSGQQQHNIQQTRSELRPKPKQNEIQKLAIMPTNNNRNYKNTLPIQLEDLSKAQDKKQIKIITKQNIQGIQTPLSFKQIQPNSSIEDSNNITKSMSFLQSNEQNVDSTKIINNKKQIKLIGNKQENNEGSMYYSVGLPSERKDVQETGNTNMTGSLFERSSQPLININQFPSQFQPQNQQQLQPMHHKLPMKLLIKPSIQQLPIQQPNQIQLAEVQPTKDSSQQESQKHSATSYLQQNFDKEKIDLESTEQREQQMVCHFCGHLTSNYLNLSCSHCIHQLCLTSKFNDFVNKKTEGYISCLCGERIGNTLLRAIINEEQFMQYLDGQVQQLIKNYKDEYGWTD